MCGQLLIWSYILWVYFAHVWSFIAQNITRGQNLPTIMRIFLTYWATYAHRCVHLIISIRSPFLVNKICCEVHNIWCITYGCEVHMIQRVIWCTDHLSADHIIHGPLKNGAYIIHDSWQPDRYGSNSRGSDSRGFGSRGSGMFAPEPRLQVSGLPLSGLWGWTSRANVVRFTEWVLYRET